MLSDRFTHSLPNPRASVLTLREGQVWPPDELDQVAGFCRTSESVTDEELRRFIPQIGEFDFPKDWEKAAYYDWNPLYQLKTGYSATESYRGAGLYLYRKYKPRFFAFYVEGTDLVSHYFWEYYRPQDFEHVPQEEIERFGSVLPGFYRYADELLGEILFQLEPGTDVILVSDHGFGPFRNPRVTLRSGSHRESGVFVACGPHFRPAAKIEGAGVLDMTPTILYLFGLPGAKDMDGRVLVESLKPEVVDQRPPELIASYEYGPRKASSASGSLADPAIKEQLRSLGYIP
jgi:arylsulfatase A-like enzyme